MDVNAKLPREMTRPVTVGGVRIGGGAPVAVQSMTCTDTADAQATLVDIVAAAGGHHRAVARSFTATADSAGKVTIAFAGVVDDAKLSGLEIAPTTTTVSSTSQSGMTPIPLNILLA